MIIRYINYIKCLTTFENKLEMRKEIRDEKTLKDSMNKIHVKLY